MAVSEAQTIEHIHASRTTSSSELSHTKMSISSVFKKITGPRSGKGSKNAVVKKSILQNGSMGSATTATLRSDTTALVAKNGVSFLSFFPKFTRKTPSSSTNTRSRRHELLDVTATSSASFMSSTAMRALRQTSGKSPSSDSAPKARAIFCPAPRRNLDHEIDDMDNEHRERMYADATWRMYDRIMTARSMRPQPVPAGRPVPTGGGSTLVAPKAIRAVPPNPPSVDSSENRRYQEYGGVFALDDC